MKPRPCPQAPRRDVNALRWAVAMFVASLAWTALHAGEPKPADSNRQDRYNLLSYRDRKGNDRPVQRWADWENRRAQILDAVTEVMGPMPGAEKRCPLDVQVTEEVDCGSYLRRFISYASEPGSRVPAYLLIPKNALGRHRTAFGVLCLHQTHREGQKVVVGLGNSPDDEYGVELAERGYVCLAPAYPLLANYAPDWRALGYQSASMKAIWDNRRGLDVLESLPFVKRGRFAAIGHSLGGHNSVFTSLFDPRIRVVVSSCGLDSFLDYMGGDFKGWTGERYMPNLARYTTRTIPFDFHELIGALAPRHCLISAPYGDSNFRWESVDRVAGAARQIYGLAGKPGNLLIRHPDVAHQFPKSAREEAYHWIDTGLGRER